jgi:hypothetical protein
MALKDFTLIPALALMLAPAAAFAHAIPVANPSFETLSSDGLNNFCGGSCAFSTGLAIPGWNTTGSQTGQWITGGFDGNPPAIDGSVLAYSNGGAISQEVGSAIAGDTYTLQVDVLARSDAPLDAVVQLEINGLVVATAAPAVPQVAGNWPTGQRSTLLRPPRQGSPSPSC